MEFFGVNEIEDIQFQLTQTGIDVLCIQVEVQGEKGLPKQMVLLFQPDQIRTINNIMNYNNN